MESEQGLEEAIGEWSRGSVRRLEVGLKWAGNLRDCGPGWDAGTSDVSGRAVLMVAETERSLETVAVKPKCERDLEDIGQRFQMGFSSILVINHPSCLRDF